MSGESPKKIGQSYKRNLDADLMAGLKPPKIGDRLVPVFTDEELAALLDTCKGGRVPEPP